VADGKPGRRARGTVSGDILVRRAELADRLAAWNPLGLSGPPLVESYGDLANAVLGHLMRGGHTVQLEALMAGWLRRRAGRTVPAHHEVRIQAEVISRWWLDRR
jgi:hypothetical protein